MGPEGFEREAFVSFVVPKKAPRFCRLKILLYFPYSWESLNSLESLEIPMDIFEKTPFPKDPFLIPTKLSRPTARSACRTIGCRYTLSHFQFSGIAGYRAIPPPPPQFRSIAAKEGERDGESQYLSIWGVSQLLYRQSRLNGPLGAAPAVVLWEGLFLDDLCVDCRHAIHLVCTPGPGRGFLSPAPDFPETPWDLLEFGRIGKTRKISGGKTQGNSVEFSGVCMALSYEFSGNSLGISGQCHWGLERLLRK